MNRKKEKTVNEYVVKAFADRVRESWINGYHDGLNGEGLRHEFTSRNPGVIVLSDVYTMGHLAGREDASDETGWGGIKGLKEDYPEDMRQADSGVTNEGPTKSYKPELILPKWIVGVSIGILTAQLAMWVYVLSRLP